MDKVMFISETEFNNKFHVRDVDLYSLEFISHQDIKELKEIESKPKIQEKIKLFFQSYLIFSMRHPDFLYNFVIKRFVKIISGSANTKVLTENDKYLKRLEMIYERRVRIAKAFRPSVLLEIGTYLGLGATAFKLAMPKCTIYTMSPKETDSNNPTDTNETGYFYKKKKLNIKQIWSDSTKYNFKGFRKVDVSYIDGNHSYKFVYKDLINMSKVTTKCVMVDDYVPYGLKNSESDMYGPWNETVVNAVNDFLKNNSNEFENAYWIKGTQLCILVK